jgi:hypothetical protein
MLRYGQQLKKQVLNEYLVNNLSKICRKNSYTHKSRITLLLKQEIFYPIKYLLKTDFD